MFASEVRTKLEQAAIDECASAAGHGTESDQLAAVGFQCAGVGDGTHDGQPAWTACFGKAGIGECRQTGVDDQLILDAGRVDHGPGLVHQRQSPTNCRSTCYPHR